VKSPLLLCIILVFVFVVFGLSPNVVQVLSALELTVGSSHMEVKLLPPPLDAARSDPSGTGLGSFPNFSPEVPPSKWPEKVARGNRRQTTLRGGGGALESQPL
jgi:hypothetical protein